MEQTIKPNGLKSQVLLRDATEADVPFIFNSWLKSYQGATAVKNIPAPIYFANHHQLIETLLKRCIVKVAANISDNSQLYGYIVLERVEEIPVVHFAYIKHIFRKMGLCSLLFAECGLTIRDSGFYTHQTFGAKQLLDSASSKLVYNPYLGHK